MYRDYALWYTPTNNSFYDKYREVVTIVDRKINKIFFNVTINFEKTDLNFLAKHRLRIFKEAIYVFKFWL